MKILYVSEAKSIHTQRWANYYHSQGHEVQIASFRNEVNSIVPINILKTHGFGKFGYLLAVFQLKKIYEEFKPDIVHAQHITSYGFISALSGFHPLIVTAWGSDILVTPEKSFISRLLVKYALKKADSVMTVAEHMNSSVHKYCKSCKDVEAVPFGVDLDIFSLPEKYERDEKVLKIISTRNFTKIYSVDTLIRAIDILNKEGFSVSLDLVGAGELREELESLVEEFSLQEIVTFHGYVNEEKLVKLLQKADVFVTSSLSDGNNISLNEAMACGCFPIATDIPANSQWIVKNENGFLFDVYDYKQLSKLIIKAKDITFREKARIINREIVEKKANWKACVQHMTNKYNKLLELNK